MQRNHRQSRSSSIRLSRPTAAAVSGVRNNENNNKLTWLVAGFFLVITIGGRGGGIGVVGFSSIISSSRGGFTKNNRGGGRYFTKHLIAPPLDPADEVAVVVDGTTAAADLPITYTNDPDSVTRWLADNVVLSSTECILGFDVESVPDAPWVNRRANFRGPATIQLATTESSLVVQLARKGGRPSSACIPILEAVLRDQNIIKCGVGLDDDLIDLRNRFRSIEARSRLELGLVGATRSQTTGLKTLSRFLLGLNLPKSKKTAMSDWSQVPLSERQIVYSARDAWAGAAIADALCKIDPDTFAVPALVQRLCTQPSLRDLQKKRRTRKQAKAILSLLRSESKDSRRASDESRNGGKFPSWKVELMRELKNVIQENKPQREDVFEIAMPFRTNNDHGLAIASNVTSAW